MNKNLFTELGVSSATSELLEKIKITQPTKIQLEAIPKILNGKNILAKAPTGTGKTAAFAIPIVELIKNKHEASPRVIVLSPTRELSEQILQTFKVLQRNTDLKSCLIIGGVRENSQTFFLNEGIDVVVATPGRLKDLIRSNKIDVRNVKYFVLDEVDMMLDMGFIEDIKFIYKSLKTPVQTTLFSATLPDKIKHLASKMMQSYDFIEAFLENNEIPNISQKLFYINNNVKPYLLREIIKQFPDKTFMVFCNRKKNADLVSNFLYRSGIKAKSIHGDKPQNVRRRTIDAFKKGICNVLVATDVAARGIHVDNIGIVVNFEIPNNTDSYVHRMGRTGRARQDGECFSFCSPMERNDMQDIMKRMKNIVIEQLDSYNLNDVDSSSLVNQMQFTKSNSNSHHNKSNFRKNPKFGAQNSQSENKYKSYSRGESSSDKRTFGRSTNLSKKTNHKFNSNNSGNSFAIDSENSTRRSSFSRKNNSKYNAPRNSYMKDRATGGPTKRRLRIPEKMINENDDWDPNL